VAVVWSASGAAALGVGLLHNGVVPCLLASSDVCGPRGYVAFCLCGLVMYVCECV
jgi:hypothetical protein